jgi:hypothetical protein
MGKWEEDGYAGEVEDGLYVVCARMDVAVVVVPVMVFNAQCALRERALELALEVVVAPEDRMTSVERCCVWWCCCAVVVAGSIKQ